MSEPAIRVLLGLSPPDEQAIEQLLYASELVSVVAAAASTSELFGLAAAHTADAVLLSADLPGLDSGAIARLRATGLRSVGLAQHEAAANLLAGYDVDAVVRPPLTQTELCDQLRPDTAHVQPHTNVGSSQMARAPESPRPGNVLAIVGSKGAPGASELAASFAALLAARWPVLLAEFDGDGGQLALRLDADPHEGSLLGLARAIRRDDPDLQELLSGWLAGGTRGWPPVLLGPPEPHATVTDLTAPALVQRLLEALANAFELVVCDVGCRLARGAEPDAAVRLHRELLVSADVVLLVLGHRQEQLSAGFRQLATLLSELSIPPERIRVVVNGQGGPGSATSADTVAAISRELAEHGLAVDAWLPWDAKALRSSVRLGLPLALAHRRGSYAKKLERLLESVLVPTTPKPLARKRRLRPEPLESRTVEEVALPWRH